MSNCIEIPGLRDRLTILPNELLLLIASHLRLRDLLKIRLFFPKLQNDNVFEILKDALKDTPLYVSPTTASLRSFNDFCANTFFNGIIRQVAFIPRALGGLQDRGEYLGEPYGPCWVRSFDDYKSLGSGDRIHRTQRSYQVYKRFLREHAIDYPSTFCGGETAIDDSVQEALVQGLSQLPVLNAIAIAARCCTEGFNLSTMWYSPHADLSCEGEQALEKTLYHYEIDAARDTALDDATIEQVGAIFLALNKIGKEVKTLKLGMSFEDMPLNLRPFDAALPAHASALDFISNVEDLTIAYHNESWEEEEMFLWPRVVENAHQVRKLTILVATGPNISDWQITNEQASELVNCFLSSKAFPLLQQLALEAGREMPAIIHATRLQHFLSTHGQLLREVRLKNVIPSIWTEGQGAPWIYDNDEEQPVKGHLSKQEVDDWSNTMMCLLKSAAADLAGLRTFELTVSLRDAHDDKHESCVRRKMCTGFCQSYALACGKHCPRDAFENLAATLNIALKDDRWDFGEFVMAQGVGQLTSRCTEL